MLQERGYQIREIANVLLRRVDQDEKFDLDPPGLAVEPVAVQEFPSWARMVVQGFAGADDVPEEHVAMLTSDDPRLHAFFGSWNASRCGGAAMDVHEGLATFFGDATLVHARGHGVQLALLRQRLQKAAELGCDLATASVVPGSISHRNYERAGFQLVYGRVMVSRTVGRIRQDE
jgi:hypothetical protein